mmetsp:Transcript_62909/g.202860  ORF Transcript_62909/g.202860 Transcript_62909/m.202860 type:complete len:204 (-) Transcript_62909:163-774(-)
MYTSRFCTVMFNTRNSEVWMEAPGSNLWWESCGTRSICLRLEAQEPMMMEHICVSKGKFNMSISHLLFMLIRRVQSTFTPVSCLKASVAKTRGVSSTANMSSSCDTWLRTTMSGVHNAFDVMGSLSRASPESNETRSSDQQSVRSSTRLTVPATSSRSWNFTNLTRTPTARGPPSGGTGGRSRRSWYSPEMCRNRPFRSFCEE